MRQTVLSTHLELATATSTTHNTPPGNLHPAQKQPYTSAQRRTNSPHTYVSMRLARISFTMLDGWASRSLNTDSTTDISVAVVSRPQNALQSFTSSPAPITSEPRLMVPATNGTWGHIGGAGGGEGGTRKH